MNTKEFSILQKFITGWFSFSKKILLLVEKEFL